MNMIEKDELEQLKDMFISHKECDNINERIKEQLANNNIRLSVIENDIKIGKWLLTTVTAGIISIILKLFLGG